MAYSIVLTLHSLFRWFVLVSALIVVARSIGAARKQREYVPTDQFFTRIFVGSLDLQIVVGLILYFFLSPLTPHTADAFKASMKSSVLRFFAVEHVTAMLLAAACAHIGSARARKLTGTRAHKQLAIFAAVALVLVAAGIPWPGLPYGRALLRLP